MKEKIYTIPVNEAFEEDCECPFCVMYKKLDEDTVDFMLGPSYMEDDIRMETNKMGFCDIHFHKMYERKNLLGLGLMIETHINDIVENIEKVKTKKAPKKKLFSKEPTENIPIVSYLNELEKECYICNKIENIFLLYIDTFLQLYKKDDRLKTNLLNSKGFCLKHFRQVLEASYKTYSEKDYEEFKDVIVSLQVKNMNRLKHEVELFTNKFDCKYDNIPYGTSKDSIPRGINKICGNELKEL